MKDLGLGLEGEHILCQHTTLCLHFIIKANTRTHTQGDEELPEQGRLTKTSGILNLSQDKLAGIEEGEGEEVREREREKEIKLCVSKHLEREITIGLLL